MLISRQRRFVFVHVPKTAGISTQRMLQTLVSDAKLRADSVRHGPDNLEDYYHPLARDIRRQVGPAWETYFSFAFVRNPWDRMVSWYEMAKQRKDVRSPSLDRIRGLTFEQFLTMDPPAAHANTCQTDYLTDIEGNRIVTFIGQYENLRKDWGTICQLIQVPAFIIKTNFTKHEPYQTYYTDQTRDLVGERFQRDLDLFGYTF